MVLLVLGRTVVLRRTVRPRSVVMLGAVVPVMTLSTLLVHYQPQKGVWGKGKRQAAL